MADAFGRDTRLIMRRQADFATNAAAVDGNFLLLPTASFDFAARAGLEPTAENPHDRFPSPLARGLRSASGSATAFLNWESIGWWLYAMFGAPVTTTVASAQQHVFRPDANDAPVFHTFEVAHPRLATPAYHRCFGVAVRSLEFDSRRQSGAQTFNFGLIGRTEAFETSSLDATPVARSETGFAHNYDATLTVGGSPLGACTGFSVRVDNGTQAIEDIITGTPDVGDIQMDGMFSASGTLTMRFRDLTQVNAAKAGTKLAISVLWSNGLTGANLRSLKADFHNVRLSEESPRVAGSGPITIAFPWQLDAPDSGVSPCTFTLTNGRTNYDMPV